MDSDRGSARWLRGIVVALLAVVALATRLPAPWRVEVINDEMYHLESWIRRYRTDDIAPLFHRQITATRVLDSRQKQWVEDLYRSSPLVQRLVCIKNDYGSFGFSAVAEVIEALSHSSLRALRLPSVAFAMGTILLAYGLGAALKDRMLGLWLAAFVTLGPLPQVYAGLGRPHGLTQFALFLVFYRFVLEQKRNYPSPWRLWLAALFAQTTHLTCWATVGLLVLCELWRRYRNGASLASLARQTWWYAAVSAVFLGIIAVNAVGTSFFSANTKPTTTLKIWTNFCLASPFSHLARFGVEGLWLSGLLFGLLMVLGVAILLRSDPSYRGVRGPLLLVAAVALAVPFKASNEVRHLMIYGVAPLILAAIGARGLFRSETTALVAVAALLLGLGAIALIDPEDSYHTIVASETRYSEAADRLARAMKPGDVWISWPYFVGVPLYRSHKVPEPLLPLNEGELEEALRDRPADRACFVLTSRDYAEALRCLRPATTVTGFENGLVILKFPPEGRGDPARVEANP
ncbi:MAG: hypothetical protein IRY99_04395 [Isosphaeraceae bacterium]|nr:hypothetical protein [Isosphaeraceae bacterium]